MAEGVEAVVVKFITSCLQRQPDVYVQVNCMLRTCVDRPPHTVDRLVSLVVKESASRAEDPGFGSRLQREFWGGSSHTSDLKVAAPVATHARRLVL